MKEQNMRLKQTLWKAILGGHLIAAVALAQPPTYKVTDLGAVGPNGQPFAITNNGRVAGATQVGEIVRAELWYKGRVVDLGQPGLKGQNSQAFGVNAWGQAVGEAQTDSPDPQGEDFCGFAALGLASSGTTCLPFVWQNGVMRPLPTLGGSNGQANQINSQGEAAGMVENDTPDSTCPPGGPQKLEFKPVVWQNGNVRELPTYPGDSDGNAHAINDSGHAAGGSGVCGAFNPIWGSNLQPLHALLWEGSETIDLGSLGGTGHGDGIMAIGLNNHDQVIGSSDLEGDATFHAFLWTHETGMQDLGTVPGDVDSAALGINDLDQIVGVSLDANFNPRAFLRQGQELIDLNTLVPAGSPLYLASACSINAAGEIVGFAFDNSGNVHAYLAVP
jgi:probable HAF family extracellular repeat protein